MCASKFKKTILIDLDGVLNQYKGKYDKNFIPPAAKGSKEFLTKLSKDFEIKLFTTRNKILASKWLIENDLDIFIDDITNIKELAWLYVDDRCLKFDGNYNTLFKNIKDFKVWYKE